MLAIVVCVCLSVCLSVCHKSVPLKRLNVGSRKQCHTTAQRLELSDAENLYTKLKRRHPNGGAKIPGARVTFAEVVSVILQFLGLLRSRNGCEVLR